MDVAPAYIAQGRRLTAAGAKKIMATATARARKPASR